MSDAVVQIHRDELNFLLSLKSVIGKLNNRIHDKLSKIAIAILEEKHPDLRFQYGGAAASGIDIRGFNARDELKVIAEVKTTHTSEGVPLRGPQKQAIKGDLERLASAKGELLRYLVVISPHTRNAIERQLDTVAQFPRVRIIDVGATTADDAE